MEWLDKLLGQVMDSQAQLDKAKANNKKYSPEIERGARAKGFKSAQEMLLFEQRRKEGGTVSRGKAGHAVNEARNAFSRGDAMAWHPKNLLDMAAAAFERTKE